MTAPKSHSIEGWAKLIPGTIVAIDGDRRMTWSELDRKAIQLAEALNRAGINAGDVIGVRTQIAIEWLVIHAASRKLRTTIAAINWRLTAAEVDYILLDSGAKALLIDDLEPTLILERITTPLDVIISANIANSCDMTFDEIFSIDAPDRDSSSDYPLIIYTSGTTGFPKGVLMDPNNPSRHSHIEVREYLTSVSALIPRDVDDVVLIALPLSHLAGPAQIKRTLAFGARIILLRKFTPEAALKIIEKHKVTIWISVPTMLNRVAALPDGTAGCYDLTSLKAIQVGGAPISPSVKIRTAEIFGANVLHETYGSTETGMVTHLPTDAATTKLKSCGVPFKHVRVEIRNANAQPVAAGEVGEVWTYTPVVIDNYLNGAPLGSDQVDANGFFRTGDVGYLDTDGFLYITDRMKDMIVSGGVNISPAEIEAVIHEHPAIEDVAVIGVPDPDFGERIRAFVELKAGYNSLPDDLVAVCRGRLASYKMPLAWEIVTQLPRNDAGKILKRVLREPFWLGQERKI